MTADLRCALLLLRARPGFAAVVALTLALGIGANTAIFSVVNAVLLRPPPFPNPDQLVYVYEHNLQVNLRRSIASPANFLDWRERNHVFAEMSAWRTWFYTLTAGGEPEQVWGVCTSSNFFQLLGVRAARGRTFLPAEEHAGRDAVVVISHGLWRRRFGADPNLIGQTIVVDRRPLTVIGILPADFNLFGGQRQYDLWMPFVFERDQLRRDDYSILVFARLRPDRSLDQAQAEMSGIARQLEQEYPATNRHRGVQVITMREQQIESLRPALLVLLAAVGLVLLIACANVAHLLLAHTSARRKELAVRAALGARPWRLARQLLVESLVLAGLGGALGLLLAVWGLALLRAVLPADGVGAIPRVDQIGLDPTVLLFTLLISFLTGIIFGSAPAVRSARANLNVMLKGAAHPGESQRGRRLSGLMVVSEVALAAVLLIGAGLMLRSLHRLLAVNPGLDPANLLTMQLWLSASNYPEAHEVTTFYRQTLERIRALPGVEAASAINFLPFSGWWDFVDFAIEGRAPAAPGEAFTAPYRVIDPDYFRAMRIPLRQGRPFTEQDTGETTGVAIINETMARRFWPGENPVGQRIQTSFPAASAPWRPRSNNAWLTILGVAGDVRELGLAEEIAPQIYLPYRQQPSSLMTLVVRAPTEPGGLAAAVRRAVLEGDKNQPVTEVKGMEQIIAESVSRRRLNLFLLGVFALLALVLATGGISSVVSYSVTQRTREIGIRLALGAQPGDMLGLVVGQGMLLIIIGLAVGLIGAWALTRLMASLLYGVTTTDPATFAIVTLLLTVVALLACYVPARRATKVDPIIALRCE